MSFPKSSVKGNTLLYAALSLTVLIIFSFSFFFETIPYHDGAGFDGTFYQEVFRSFSTDFFSTGYDSFRIQRIFPFCLLHYVYKAFSIPLDNIHMTMGVMLAQLINLLLQLFLFFRLAKLQQWKTATTTILFALFFYNFGTLKNCGYDPYQTDSFAVTIALGAYYLLLQKKWVASNAVSLLGLITWPIIPAINALLTLFHQQPAAPSTPNKLGSFIYRYSPLAYLLAVAGIVVALTVANKAHVFEILLMAEPTPWCVTLSLAVMFILLKVLFSKASPFPWSIKQLLSAFSFKRAILLAIPIVAIKVVLWFHTNNEFFFDGKLFLLQTLIRPLKYPAITLAGHTAYWGILPLLILVFFRNFSQKFTSASPGHALAFLALALFALDSEARHIATFIPLILVALGDVLDEMHLGARKVATLVALQLFLSHFYIPINGEGMSLALENEDFSTFPAQMLLMNFGAWMTPETYIFWIIAALGTLFALLKLLKPAE